MRRRRLETGITRPLGVAGLLKRAVAMAHRQRRIAVPVTPRLRIGLVFGGNVILLLPDLIARRLHIGQIGAGAEDTTCTRQRYAFSGCPLARTKRHCVSFSCGMSACANNADSAAPMSKIFFIAFFQKYPLYKRQPENGFSRFQAAFGVYSVRATSITSKHSNTSPSAMSS